jgi:hypothetical protein
MRASINQPVHFLTGKPRKLASSKLANDRGLQKAASMGLIRIAGNVFECPSSRDLWKVDGDKVMRVSSVEVDFHESLKPADPANPDRFLKDILAELDF